MQSIVITTESGADISPEEAEHYGIEIVPMHVEMGGITRDDGTFPAKEICEYYDRTGKLPQTSGCTPGDFCRAFDNIHNIFPDAKILHMAYSALTSVSCASAHIAAEDRDYVTIVDTHEVSVGHGFIVVLTAKKLMENPDISIEELTAYAENVSGRTRMGVLPLNLEYLRAGGRCSNIVAIGSELFKLHPCIEILGGELKATRRYRGNLKIVVPKFIRQYCEENHLQKNILRFLWSPGLPDDIKELAEKTAKECGYHNFSWGMTGCVITVHGGPSCFGVIGLSED